MFKIIKKYINLINQYNDEDFLKSKTLNDIKKTEFV